MDIYILTNNDMHIHIIIIIGWPFHEMTVHNLQQVQVTQ